MTISSFASACFHRAITLLRAVANTLGLAGCGLWLLTNATTVSAQPDDENAACQTADWYLAPAFRNNDPNRPEAGWNAPIISPCVKDSDRPERIVYVISGPFGADIHRPASSLCRRRTAA